MNLPAATARLLWPRDASYAPSGYIVGWNSHSFFCTIAAIIPAARCSLFDLERMLVLLGEEPELHQLVRHCGGTPVVLGVWIGADGTSVPVLDERVLTAQLWLTLVSEEVDSAGIQPALREVHCCGCRHTASLHLVYYVPTLAVWIGQRQPWEQAGAVAPAQPPSELECSLRQAGCAEEIRTVLGRRFSVVRTGSNAVSITSAAAAHVHTPRPGLRRVGRQFSLLVRATTAPPLLLAAAVVSALRAPLLPPVSTSRLIDVSMAAAALDSRLAAALAWGARWDGVRTAPRWERRPQLERLRLASDVTCALVDMGLGFVAAAAIRHCWPTVDGALARPHFHVGETQLQELVLWLMGVDPGGFKLNENLNHTFGSCVLALLRGWEAALGAAAGLLRVGIVPALLVCCSAGATVGLGVASDLLALATLHLRALHIAMASVYTAYLSALSSLFKLFRGRKFNVLRQRVDSQDYDTEQLLLGTLFFTVLTFLLPTVAAYYTLATVLRAAALSVHASLLALRLPLDGFPWLPLLLWALRSSPLAGGVCFQVRGAGRRAAYFELVSVHTPLGLFFARLRSSVHMADFFSQILPTPHAPAVLSVSRTATANCLEERERDAPCREPRLTALIRLQAVQLGLQSCG